MDTESILRSLGYEYIKRVEPPIEPIKTSLRFVDIAPELKELEIANHNIYKHQLESLEGLEKGYNIILRSGTGSGKTEAWFFYFFNKAKRDPNFRAIALYPTLALANDQINRISRYSSTIGIKVMKLDAQYRDLIVRENGVTGLRRSIASSQLIITNPAFLLNEIKKLLLKPQSSHLQNFLKKLNLLVIDEMDFYGPRSIALILAMLKILIDYSDIKPQIVVLTATLANPEDVCSYIEGLTGRKCLIIDGKPFRVENRIYVVLGKNIRDVWEKIRGYKLEILKNNNIDRDIVRALEDFDIFRRNPYRVIQYLEALGLEVPSINMDYKEMLSNYSKDDGVTLVFTRSIARAEEVAKGIKEIVGDIVSAHHHLISKSLREVVEEKARRGEIKIVVSPRTLVQGIDIGIVIRAVHIGLPENIREFIHREGRKGRRREIPYTETVIIPSTRWDWEILSNGFELLEKWLSLPLERTMVNPSNKYIKLFIALAKILSPWYRENISREEHEVLRNVRVIGADGSIDIDRAKHIWERINFYEYGPPYGIKRYLEEDGKLVPLEPIGHCDLVERFQMGCLDPSQDAMVIGIEKGRKGSRIVRYILEKRLSKLNIFSIDALAEAFEEYRYIKTLWGEDTSFLRDIARGKLHSYVLAVVYPPKQGFGELKKIPNRVLWQLISNKPRISKIGDKYIISYDRKTIYVPVETAGEYRDYTYGMIFDVEDSQDSTLLRLGLAYLMIILRRVYGIPFETIMYSVEKIGEKKFFTLHEPEAAGLIETIEWDSLRKIVEDYKPDELDIILMNQIDDIAYSDLLSLGIDLSILKNLALRIIDYIQLKDKVAVLFKGRKLTIPRPSKAHRLLTIDALSYIVNEDESIPKVVVGLDIYDGEEEKSCVELYVKYPFTPPPRSLRDLENIVEDLVYYNDYSILVFDRIAIAKELENANLRRLSKIVSEKAISLKELFTKIGIEILSLSSILPEISIEGYDLSSYVDDITRFSTIIVKNVEDIYKLGKLSKSFIDTVTRFLSARSRALYILYLVINSLMNEK